MVLPPEGIAPTAPVEDNDHRCRQAPARQSLGVSSAASVTATVNAVTRGAAEPRPSFGREYNVPAPVTKAAGSNCSRHDIAAVLAAGGVTQAMAARLVMHDAICCAVP